MEARGKELIAEDHYEADRITELMEAARGRLEQVRDKCEARARRLQASRHLQQFLRKVFDIKTWVKEKVQVALDESYCELSNLVNKIQKHSSFEAEIAANKPRLLAIQEEGEDLCRQKHFAGQEIAGQLEDLQSEWSHLMETSNLKKTRLHEANSALVFFHSVDEFEAWLDEVEAGLESGDHGKDLNSVTKLLKRLGSVEAEVGRRREALRALEAQCDKYAAAKHFMAAELEGRLDGVAGRYEALQVIFLFFITLQNRFLFDHQ